MKYDYTGCLLITVTSYEICQLRPFLHLVLLI